MNGRCNLPRQPDDFSPDDAPNKYIRAILENYFSEARPLFDSFDSFFRALDSELNYWLLAKVIAPPGIGREFRQYICYPFWEWWEYGCRYTETIGSDSEEVAHLFKTEFRQPVRWADVQQGQDLTEGKKTAYILDTAIGAHRGLTIPLVNRQGAWALSISSASLSQQKIDLVWNRHHENITSEAWRMLRGWLSLHPETQATESLLSKRQQQVTYLWLFHDLPDEEIAKTLAVKVSTVQEHKKRSREKLGNGTSAQLAIEAYKRGIVP